MAERCFRVRRCELASLGMIRGLNRGLSLVAKAAGIVVESVVGIEVVIGGVDVMSSGGAVDAKRIAMRCPGLSTVRLRRGWIRRRLCFLR